MQSFFERLYRRFILGSLLLLLFGPGSFAQDEVKSLTVVVGDSYHFDTNPRQQSVRSSNPLVAYVNNRGVLRTRRPGTTFLTISSRPSSTKRIRITVLPKRDVRMGGDFPILAWYSLQEDVSHQRFEELADAGFNLSFSYATDSIVPQMKRAIEAVRGTGIRLVIPFRGNWIDVKPIVDFFKNDPGLWGWYLADEPSSHQFEEVKSFRDKIAEMVGISSDYGECLQMLEQKLLFSFRHVFPFHLFREGEKIIIYGAGDIGQEFYREVKQEPFVKVLAVVDKNADQLTHLPMPVSNLSVLEHIDYDSILISIHDEYVAGEVRKMLIEMGVNKDKIKWDGKRYYKDEFYQNYYFGLMNFLNNLGESHI